MLELIIQLLDKAIHEQMTEFKQLGILAKKLYEDDNKSGIEKAHASMAHILFRLDQVIERVNFLYPEYVELFELLTNKKTKTKDGK